MPRLLHGAVIRFDTIEVVNDILADGGNDLLSALDLQNFDFMFPTLQADDANLLPTANTTVARLIALGRSMRDPGDPAGADPGDATIPAIHTYLGQFIDHDITLEAVSAQLPELLDSNLTPLPLSSIQAAIRNLRTATLDLDSVYGQPAPRDPVDGNKMQIGTVADLGNLPIPASRPVGKSDDNDVPREAPSSVPSHDRAALIGDPRNDENLIVAQLHVAFLRAHNAIVKLGHTFDEARTLLRQHYQHIILHEFLKTVADPAIVDDILQNGNRVFDPADDAFFMPLEYSVAAYRFGHTMIRAEYDFNVNFNSGGTPAVAGTFNLLFTFTALSGQIGGGILMLPESPTLPENWIIEWERFIEGGTNPARRIDTKLVEPLFELTGLTGGVLGDDGARLAVRNLLRGYLLRMPTGQAVATALGRTPLTPAELQAAAASPLQVQALTDGGFLDRTPLWYYILAEANHGGGSHLGPVGSTIVAEVLIGLIRRSEDSILSQAAWAPSLPSAQAGSFLIADLLRLAGVLP